MTQLTLDDLMRAFVEARDVFYTQDLLVPDISKAHRLPKDPDGFIVEARKVTWPIGPYKWPNLEPAHRAAIHYLVCRDFGMVSVEDALMTHKLVDDSTSHQ